MNAAAKTPPKVRRIARRVLEREPNATRTQAVRVAYRLHERRIRRVVIDG